MNDKAILLVEDNPDDEALTLRALQRNNIRNKVFVARDGVEALEFLLGTSRRQHQPVARVHLVLLDLKLPRCSGLEVLAWLRGQPRLRRCPVVVLTSSKEAPDVRRAYDLGANSYLIKPVEFQSFLDMVGTLNLYWLVLNQPADEPTAE